MKKLFSPLILLSFILFTTSCTRINVGNVGLRVNLTGSDKGVSDIKYVTGWNFYTPGLTTIEEYSTRFKSVDYEDFTVMCKGGTTFTAHPKITYRINPTLADKTYMAFGTSNMEVVEKGYLHTIITKSLGDVANKFTPDTLLYSREKYEELVMQEINNQCKDLGIDVSIFRANLTPSEAIAAAIDAKQKAIQDAQRVENEKASVIAEGEKRVAKAKLEAEALVTQAKAEAEAYKLRQQSLTPLLIQQQFLEKWNGVLPVYGSTPQLFKDITSK